MLPRLSTVLVAAWTAGASPLLGFADAREQELELAVRVVPATPPPEVSIRHEESAQQIVLASPQKSARYWFVVRRPSERVLREAPMPKLADPYLLVASWGDGSEHLRLALHPRMGPTVDVSMYRVQENFTRTAIDAIDGLGGDRHSDLEAYFRARAAYKDWSGQPRHVAALHAAKLWFDAAYRLAKGSNSPFVMDQQVVRILREYESSAKEDAYFRRRYREFVKEGYVEGMIEEIEAARYAIVGDVERLTTQRKYAEARELNATALKALESEDASVRKAVAARQGVTLEMLEANAAFLEQRAPSP